MQEGHVGIKEYMNVREVTHEDAEGLSLMTALDLLPELAAWLVECVELRWYNSFQIAGVRSNNKFQNHWVSGFLPSFGILNTIEHNVSKLDLLPSSGEGKETPTVLGTLERANQ
jgi:hypothetical protein